MFISVYIYIYICICIYMYMYIIQTSRSKWQPYNISVPLDLKVTLKDTRLILNIIYVWKLNQTVLELDFRAVNFFVLPSTGFEPTPLLHCSNIRLSEWCCSVTMVWVQIPSREEQKNWQCNNGVGYVPSTHAYTHVLRLSLDLPYETR